MSAVAPSAPSLPAAIARAGTRVRGRPALLALSSGALYAAAFPPLELFPLAWVALVPLLVAATRVRPLAAAGLGFVWSIAAVAGVGHWFPGMIAGFFDVGPLAATSAFLAAALFFGGVYCALFAALVSAAARRGRLHPLVVAGLWGGVELARSSGPIPNPWALLGYSQVPFATLVQASDVAGVLGVGMLVAAGNAVLAGAFSPALRPARPRLAAATVAVLLAAALAWGHARLGERFGQGEAIEVALVQPAIERERRFAAAHRDENLERLLGLTERAAASGADWILWPEFAVDFPLGKASPARNRLVRAARASGADVLLGAPDVRERTWIPEQFNSFFVLSGGRIADRYDKVQLMPFSERNPLPGIFEGGEDWSAGEGPRPLHTRLGAIGVLLCSEAMDADFARRTAQLGAGVLANPSNDDWFRSRSAARQQLAIARVRAIENRRWLVRPTANGFSAVLDPHGRVTAIGAFGTADIVRADVRISEARTPFQGFGAHVPHAAAAGALLFVFHPFGRSRDARGRRLRRPAGTR